MGGSSALGGRLLHRRELRLVANCVEYMDGDPAAPGRNLMILVAKMATYKGWMHHDRLDELIEMAGKADRPVRVPRGSVISVPGDLWGRDDDGAELVPIGD